MNGLRGGLAQARRVATYRTPSIRATAYVPRRYAGSKDLADPASEQNQDARLSRQPPSSEALVDHELDYDAHVDHGTSSFSVVPKKVMDGSEEGKTVAAAVLSGAPIDLQARTVRIYKPAKTATQSGDWHSHHWRMDWDVLQKGHRWQNPLIGWESSGDAMQGTHLNFKTKEDAIVFAEKQGYEYFVQEPNSRKLLPKAYASQFAHHPKKLKQIRTK